MKMRFELRPVGLLATDNEAFPHTLFKLAQQAFGNRFEVLKRLVRYSAFRVTSFISLKAVVGPTARKHVNKGLALPQLVETKIEKTRTLPVDDRNAKRRLRS